MKHLLDNIVWHSLNGAQSHFSAGTGSARRYAKGFSPIVGFADPAQPDFAALVPFCEADEHFYCDGWTGAVTSGWKVDAESTMFKMVWEGALPDHEDDDQTVKLVAGHTAQALALAMLTKPGPFGARTIELGEYFGIFDGDQLIAMAGERMAAASLREVSGVCTHPEYQGRGLARKLMLKLIRLQMHRGEVPFLHVMRDNAGARGLYERMGFQVYKESVVRVVSVA